MGASSLVLVTMVFAWTVKATNKGFEGISFHKIYRKTVPVFTNSDELSSVSKRVAESAKLVQFLHVNTLQGSPVYSNLKKSDPDPYLQLAISKIVKNLNKNK